MQSTCLWIECPNEKLGDGGAGWYRGLKCVVTAESEYTRKYVVRDSVGRLFEGGRILLDRFLNR